MKSALSIFSPIFPLKGNKLRELAGLHCSYTATVVVGITKCYIDRTYGENNWMVALQLSSYCSGGYNAALF
jgi:hypothetical protein